MSEQNYEPSPEELELKAAIDGLIETSDLADDVWADKRIWVDDALHIGRIPGIWEAYQKFDDVWPVIRKMSSAGKEWLQGCISDSAARARADVQSDKLTDAMEQVLLALVEGIPFMNRIVSLVAYFDNLKKQGGQDTEPENAG